MTERDRGTDEPHDARSPADHVEKGRSMRESAAPAERADDEVSGALNCEDGSIDFQQLAQGRREVLVRLAGQTYRLRWTRNDKLILTK